MSHKITLNTNEHDSREAGADSIGRLTEVVTFVGLLNVGDGQSAVLNLDIRIVDSKVLVISRHNP